MAQKHTYKQTDGHYDLETESAQWADIVKVANYKYKFNSWIKKECNVGDSTTDIVKNSNRHSNHSTW